MFQFPAFPIAQGNCERIPIRRSVVLPLRAGPYGFSQLGTSFVGTRAEPSTRWQSSHAEWDVHCYLVKGPVDVWIAFTHGFITRPGSRLAHVRPFPPSLARDGASVLSSKHDFGVPHLRGTIRIGFDEMDPLGFEPRASSLQRRHSTTELWAHPQIGGTISALVVQRCLNGHDGGSSNMDKVGQACCLVPVCGGDPAADSPTATLLRLKPPCEAQIRPSLRWPHPDLTRVL